MSKIGVWIPKFKAPFSAVPTLGYFIRKAEFTSGIPLVTSGLPYASLVLYAVTSYKVGRELRRVYNEYIGGDSFGDVDRST